MSLQPRLFTDLVTFTRASSGWRFNEAGAFAEVLTDLPRFDFDPVTTAPLGLLMEPARTNLFLNTATPATQSITVTGVTHTLSFTGSGSVTLSGAFTGVLEGTGATDRVTLTFKPGVGTLTLTVAGTIVRPQLEVGAYATSHIPVVGTAVTRAADFAHTLLSDFAYNPSAGTLIIAGNFQEGELILQLNALQIVADETGSKTYTVSYDSTPGGDRIQLGRGTFRSVAYYPTAFGDIAPEDNPLWLFVNGEEGFFNDITTWPTSYFTDTAGTDPAVLEDTIGLVLDQSGNDIDLTQATAGARPKLSAGYNLLQRTEEFDNAYYLPVRATVAANASTGPNGELTADKLVEDTSTSTTHFLRIPNGFVGGAPAVFSVSVEAGERHRVATSDGGSNRTTFDLSTGSVVSSGAGSTANIIDEGGGWYRIEDTREWGFSFLYLHLDDGTSAVYTGDGTSGVYIWGADLRLASDTDQPAYQRVTTATDYDSEGFDPYLQFDQVDDALVATIPAITGGTLVLATRQGIWIDDDINASAGTFSIGPTTYTGGPAGLLSVIGNKLIGPPVLLDRQLTSSEQSALVQWFQNRGAGALYVLGEEVFDDPDFNNALDWVLTGQITGGQLLLENGELARQDNKTDLTAKYLAVVTVVSKTGGNLYIAPSGGGGYDSGALRLGTSTNDPGVYRGVVTPTGSGNAAQIVFLGAGQSCVLDSVSLRELTQPGA
jgi:hypothetical protein